MKMKYNHHLLFCRQGKKNNLKLGFSSIQERRFKFVLFVGCCAGTSVPALPQGATGGSD